jgi:repressor LexA
LSFANGWIKIQVLDVFSVDVQATSPRSEEPVDDSPKLTSRQQQILELIQHTIERTGAPPTRAEIAAELGYRSPNAAEEHLKALARKGVIDLVSGTSRGIRIKSDTLRRLNASRLRGLDMTGFESGPTALLPLNLPLIGRVAAGSPILAQEHVERTFSVEPYLFAHKPDYLLKVRGMSMRDAGILDGDLLAVQKASDAKNGQIVVARLGDEVTVKRFRRTASGVELIPENPDFQTIQVPAGSTEFSLEGLAVGLIRNTLLS